MTNTVTPGASDRRGIGDALPARRATWLLVIALLLVAANLRPALTSVGPVLERLGGDTGLSPGDLGLLTALPLVAFAVVSPITHRISTRFGAEKTIALALTVLAVGTVLRSVGGSVSLWSGTVVIGAAIAVGNVLLPGLIKRHFPLRVIGLTGAYTGVLYLFAALGSGLAVPVADAAEVIGLPAGAGWRAALAVWALLALVALVLWMSQLRLAGPRVTPTAQHHTTPDRPTVNMWTSRVAWQVALFMGLQSTTFYTTVAWLPSIAMSLGRSEVQAGWDLFLFVGVGIPSSLLTPWLLRRGADQRLAASVASVLMLVGLAGLLLLPHLLLLWVTLAGLGAGSALATALTIIATRARSHHQATALSGMAQSVGYLLAACGPFALGVLYDATGVWSVPLLVLTAVAVLQLLAGLAAARRRFVD